MKKLTILFLLFSILSFAQKEYLSDSELNFKLDSLNIEYKSQEAKLIKMKNDVTDLYNTLIFKGDYKKEILSQFVKYLNSVQDEVVFTPNMTSEKIAIEQKNNFSKIIDLKIKSFKYGLLGNELLRLQEVEDRKNAERFLTFLRETNYSPSEFKKISFEERLKLVENFEMNKQGITPEVINYYKSMNDDEKSLIISMKNYTSKSIDSSEIYKYKKLIDDKVIYKNYDWSDNYFLTVNFGEKILNYIKHWQPKGY
ncbi:MAG: hypothetical protein ACK40Y_09590 [Cloacibacterium caeni]